MKIVLLENLRKLGSIGEIINVKRGYARNFLIPQKKALFASEKNIKEAKKDSNKISIIGGQSIYKEFMPLANKLLITEIDIVVEKADTFFPAWDNKDWTEKSRIKSMENGIEYSFVEYLRN